MSRHPHRKRWGLCFVAVRLPKKDLHLLHRGTQGSPQDVYRSVYVSIVVRATFRTGPLPIRERKIFVVMSTIRARFCSRCPLPDLNKLTIMFQTFELQYLNKLPKGEIGDLTSPEAFHCLKVQRLGGDKIEPLTQVGRRFVVPISALVDDFAIKPCEFTDSTPPIARAFDLSTDGPAEFSELVQGAFQGLSMVNSLTGVQCQIGIHAEVYPYTFTRSGQNFFGSIICHDIKPQCSDGISTDLNILDGSLRVAMLVIQVFFEKKTPWQNTRGRIFLPNLKDLLLPISIGGMERLSFSVVPLDEVRSIEFFLYGVVPCVMFKRSSEFGRRKSLFLTEELSMSSHRQASPPSWSRQEFSDLDLGDTRLNDRLVDITDALTAQPMSPISTACGDISASGVPLGCLTDKVWVRDASDKGDYKTKPLAAKESYKWLEALSQTQTRTVEGVEVITVCDREADIYEFFVEAKEHPFVIRAAQTRRSEDTYGTLKDLVNHTPVAGELRLDVPARPQRPARQAHLQVRFAQTTLCLPHRCQQRPETQNLPRVRISVVWVIEPNPPDDITPLNYLLLTNVEVSNFSEALQRIEGYTQRWHIEVYFKVLKSGTKVEHARFQTKDRLLRYIALLSVIAWRLYSMTLLNRHFPEADCTQVVTETE